MPFDFSPAHLLIRKTFKHRLPEPLMRKLIKKPSEMVKQIICTTQPTLFLFISFSPSQAAALQMTRPSESSGQRKALPNVSVITLLLWWTFLLLHCSTKMLPKQQEGPVHVIMALVKPLIVCIRVEFELVIGECAYCPISEPLPRKLIPGEGGSFFPSRCICGHLRRFPQEYYFRMVVILFRADPAAKCLMRSLFALLKPRTSWARIGFLPLAQKEVMAVIVHWEEDMGAIFSPFLLLSWSLQKDGYKYQTIRPHLVARAMFVGKRKSSPPPCPLGSRHLQWNTCTLWWGRYHFL